mgnify:CR=1 FL=1
MQGAEARSVAAILVEAAAIESMRLQPNTTENSFEDTVGKKPSPRLFENTSNPANGVALASSSTAATCDDLPLPMRSASLPANSPAFAVTPTSALAAISSFTQSSDPCAAAKSSAETLSSSRAFTFACQKQRVSRSADSQTAEKLSCLAKQIHRHAITATKTQTLASIILRTCSTLPAIAANMSAVCLAAVTSVAAFGPL